MTIEDTLSPELLRIKKELERLNKMKIHVGIQGASGYDENGNDEEGAPADLLTIANVHEFGATIKAKNVKNLAIPIAKKAIGKSPLDFPGLFFLRSDGYLFGCISPKRKRENKRTKSSPSDSKPKNKKPENKTIPKRKGEIEFLFILMESVNIPERSFIRAGYDSSRKAIEEVASEAVSKIVFEGWDAEKAANHVGMKVVGMIQMYMNQPMNFKPKGSVTRATSNWPDNPLVETGRLRNSITYTIEEEE